MSPLTSVAAARAALDSGEQDAAGLLELARDRNRRLDDDARPIRAFLSMSDNGGSPDDADGPLAGVPVAIKDNICTPGLPTTCGSRILEGYRSPYAATAVRRLRAAGAVVLGKTNCDEFAMGSSTENSAYGPTRNPLDRDRVPGGSSGGSTAAVAAGTVPVALGSSTGGSVRQPAAFCGIVGVKPTYGRVSRYGLVAFASSLDQIGILSRSAHDAAVVLECISGYDPYDSTSQDHPPPRAAALKDADLSGTVIGVPEEYMGQGLDDRIAALVEKTLAGASAAGATVKQVSLPHTSYAIPCYYVVAPAEASSNLARYDGVRYGYRAAASDIREMYEKTRGEGFGAEVKRRIMLGTYALSAGYYEAYYLRAQRVRQAIADDFLRVFAGGVDAIFAPTTPSPAFMLGEKLEDPYAMYLSDVYTVSANLVGIPAMSIPIGEVDGLPVGGQLMCPHWEEERMLGVAARLEHQVGFELPEVPA